MSTPVNVLVMIHGMTLDPEPRSAFSQYQELWDGLLKEAPNLSDVFPQGFIGVEWGQELPTPSQPPLEQLRDDQKLTRAQNFLNERISYDKVVRDSHPNNISLSIFGDVPLLSPLIRSLVVGLRESAVIHGFSDVIYYCSADGETRVRKAVYGQVLKQLDSCLDESDVRIHLIGQSLGVTLTHDFLYGLFAPHHSPGFCKQLDEDDPDKERFQKWRDKAQTGELKVGSLTSTASQLPLFMMRKQKLVNLLAANKLLDTSSIGINNGDGIKWKIFYDVDDLLGFCTRRLYNSPDAIMELQVDSGDNPDHAHNGYWTNKKVIAEIAKLLLENA
ncbi:MAG: hypothetical protein QNJ47_27345 [Nostocaceae cyanobacterium]|nr:hypothetical protein [Nostocaceae cyanobacterium]